MTAIWRRSETGWGIAAPASFDDEATLHDLIAEAPEILRRAPESLKLLDAATPKPIGKGSMVEATPEVLRLAARAYREAANRPDGPPSDRDEAGLGG